jgi:mono/diheme cytochrome c family protein
MSTHDFFSRCGTGFTMAIMASVVGCSSATHTGGAAPSADGGTVSTDGGGSSDSGKADASTLDTGTPNDASALDGTTEANIVDGGIGTSDSSEESDAPETTSVPPLPSLLSATGLFTSVASDGTLVLADGVQEYQPMYALWADGAQKVRWIYLPPGSKIDTTTSMDHWSFPAGTKFWKEFDLDGRRLETRLVWKYGPGPDDFLYVSYWWNPEAGIANDAEMADPFLGEQDVNGTPHDIPTEQDCETCHNAIEEHVLGFGAIELNHTLPGANIHTLIDAGSLTTNPGLPDLVIPGDEVAQAALGYLHANCGNCHNRSPGSTSAPPMYLRLLVGTKTVQETDTYTTAVNERATDFMTGNIVYRIAGQDPTDSCVTYTMEQRGDSRYEMPPLASNVVDDAGLATVSAWITTLPKP